jgi:lipopolysaccharide export system permease protein
MKNTIYKYFFHEFLRYFLISLFALSIIVWAIQSVNFLDLVTEDGHAFTTYFSYSFLTISKILTKLMPYCFLVACVFTINKLEKDNELIIVWSSGLNKIHIVNLFFRISLIIMILQLFLATILNPALLNYSRSLLKNAQLQFIPSLMKEKQFNDTVDGLTIFVEKKISKNNYKNVFIQDDGKILSEVGNHSSTIFAKTGFLSENENYLILYDGFIQNTSVEDDVRVIKFKKTTFNLSNISTKSISEPKIQETSSFDILNCIIKKKIELLNCKQTKKSLMDQKIELNKRFGMPFFIPLIALTCSFLLSSRRDKKIYKYNNHIYGIVSFLILSISEVTVRYSGISWSHTFVYYFFPLFLIPFFYLALIKKFKYENLS